MLAIGGEHIRNTYISLDISHSDLGRAIITILQLWSITSRISLSIKRSPAAIILENELKGVSCRRIGWKSNKLVYGVYSIN